MVFEDFFEDLLAVLDVGKCPIGSKSLERIVRAAGLSVNESVIFPM
jgi:hypothetical protein